MDAHSVYSAVLRDDAEQVRHLCTSHPELLLLPYGSWNFMLLSFAASRNSLAAAAVIADLAPWQVHHVSTTGYTALLLTNTEEMTELLLSLGADVTARTRTGVLALHLAALRQCVGRVRTLVHAHSDDVSCFMGNGSYFQNPLHIACTKTDTEIIQLIVQKFPALALDLDRSSSSASPVHYLIRSRNAAGLECVLQAVPVSIP